MFSFTHSSNPFPTFPSSSSSSSYPPFPFYFDPQNGFATNTFLHDPFAVLPIMPPTPQTVTNFSVSDYNAMFQKNAINDVDVHYGSSNSISKFLTKKPAAKKDRHSKIHTSKGLRDRRVRLSSKIARKFFDLQDMLECDKPSNTLEWLFTKSENAIKELARSKELVDSNDKSLVCGAKEIRKLKWEEKEAKKESREKARARARERTSSKPALEVQILHQLMPPIQHDHEAFARYPHFSEAPGDGFDVVEESIVLKRNLKPSFLSSQHQNFVIPSESSFNNNDYHSLSNSPQNWDTNGGSNGLNQSTELQILGNSWEECTNQRRHY